MYLDLCLSLRLENITNKKLQESLTTSKRPINHKITARHVQNSLYHSWIYLNYVINTLT